MKQEDIRKIAYLARLGIDEAAMPEYATSLTEILDFVEQMDSANTDNIQPMAHPQDMVQPLREDIVTEPNARELLMQNAPKTEQGLFLVPKVIE
ncbi:MAG: Asp-tRNA(Asn)/Glu-tRNA(Gln) amidotransferase subunit GatC [Pseudomonadota bacterium]